MARTRLMPTEWAKDEVIASCQPLARLLFYHLHAIADRAGNLEDRPKRIAVECLPYDSADVEALLDELQAHGLITRYEVSGVKYLAIPTFLIHQSPHIREAKSGIPPISESLGKVGTSPVLGSAEASPGSPVSVSVLDLGSGSGSIPVSVSDPKTVTVSPHGASAQTALLKLARETLHMTTSKNMSELLDCLKHHARFTKSQTKFTDDEGERALRIALDDRVSLPLAKHQGQSKNRKAG